MRGLPSILYLFCNEFNKLYMDSRFHWILLVNLISGEKVIILTSCTLRCFGRHNVSRTSWIIFFIIMTSRLGVK